MRRRNKFALAVAVVAIVLLSPLAASWLVMSNFEAEDRSSDVDGDGLEDSREARYGLDVGIVDSDGDGMRDGEEVRYWDQRAVDAGPGEDNLLGPSLDLDGDGLPNAADPDADGDGLLDGQEIEWGSDPGDADTDDDGVGDADDPRPSSASDVDHDGLPDDWEDHYGVYDPMGDEDGDGLVNLLEYAEGSSPVHAFGVEDDALVDLRAFLSPDTVVDSMADLYAPFRGPDGTLDLDRPLFQVDPTTPGRYWRLFDLKTLTGAGWDRSPMEGGADRVEPPAPTDLADWEAYVYAIAFAGRWTGPLPAPLHTQVILGLPSEGRASILPDGTFGLTGGYVTGYTITSPLHDLEAHLVDTWDEEADPGTAYTYLPAGQELPGDLEGARDLPPIQRVVEARRWLWERADYDPGREVWPLSAPLRLVDEGAGTSLDFASSLAVLCRRLDVPTRVAVGFSPGVILGGHRVVRVGDLHAWTEVHDGDLWIPVEATDPRDLGGLGLCAAGGDTSVLMDWSPDVAGLGWSIASGGALTAGAGGVELPEGPVDTDGDGIPDTTDDDDDGDGLPDLLEREIGTDPLDPDTDHDLLEDAAELFNGTSPVNGDTDWDGVADGVEVLILHTDPLEWDSDGGGACDIQELKHGTDPLDPDDDPAALDLDCDGLIDVQEAAAGTDPASWDTDLDGLTDALELAMGTDPLRADTDGDLLPDGAELDEGTDPLRRDTDGDGLTDGAETGRTADGPRWATDPTRADTDGDGLTDADEVDQRPLHVDADGDGLTDDRERRHGLNPLVADTDGDGETDLEEASRLEMEEAVETVRDGMVPVYIALVVLALAFAIRYRPFDRRIVPDMVDRLSELEMWLATMREAPDDEVRRAIYRAYRGMCEVLTEYGYLDRREAWTAREFEDAVSDALPWVPDHLLRQLTGLFEEARFSDHQLPVDYVDRARTCLAGIREALETVMGKPAGGGTAAAEA